MKRESQRSTGGLSPLGIRVTERLSVPSEPVAAPLHASPTFAACVDAWDRREACTRRAFTLVEVLVALCVFAMAAVVLGASYLNVLSSYEIVARGVKVNEDFGFAREQVLLEPDRKKLEQGGEFETSGGGRVKWSVEISSTNVPEVFSVAFNCEISRASLSDTTKRTQQFTLLRPTWVTDIPERDKLKEEMKARIHELQGKKPQ